MSVVDFIIQIVISLRWVVYIIVVKMMNEKKRYKKAEQNGDTGINNFIAFI